MIAREMFFPGMLVAAVIGVVTAVAAANERLDGTDDSTINDPDASRDAVYELREVQVYGNSESNPDNNTVSGAGTTSSDILRNGVLTLSGTSTTAPMPEVVYPRLKSRFPCYGYIRVGSTQDDWIHFVADETQNDAVANEQDKESGARKLRNLANALMQTNSSTVSVEKYDVLYIDLNRDKDLTNDARLSAVEQVPANFPYARYGDVNTKVFDYLELKSSDDGPALQFIPYLRESTRTPRLYLTSTSFRHGRVKLFGTWHAAIMQSAIGPPTALKIRSEDDGRWKTLRLGALQQYPEGFLTASVSHAGDKVTVSSYKGAMGEFQLGNRGQELSNLGMAGTLVSKNQGTFWVGNPGDYYTYRPRTCELPEGEYQLGSLYAEYGTSIVRLSANNRYPLGPSQAVRSEGPRFGIRISKDQPFVFQFARQPIVRFISPASPTQVYRRGTAIRISVLLLDPRTDMMIRGFEDKTRQLSVRTTRAPSGDSISIPRYAALTPVVSIVNSAGDEVASGPMPFGGGGSCGYTWRVPADLEIDGGSGVFTATVTFDTREIYGTVRAACQITVAASLGS